MYVFAILASIPFSIIGGVIIGLIIGLIYAAAYHVIPGSSSIIKGLVVALLLWLILSILPILILGSYLTGSYSSTFELAILNGLILYLFFGFLLGLFWDRFGHMKRCSNCDKEIPPDSRVCAYCGHNIESYNVVAPSPVTSEQISKKDNTALIVGIIVAVIVIGIILSAATIFIFLGGWTHYDYSSQDNEIYPMSSSLFVKENDTLQITNSYPGSTWDDVIVSSGEATLPSGTVDEGDTISHCSGTVVLRWASTNALLGVWSFSEKGNPMNDTVAYWQFNEGNGEIVHDSSGNNLDGVVENGVWTNRSDLNRTALSFSSTASQYVLVTDNPLFDLDTFTISAEFKPSSDIGTWPEGYQAIVAKEDQYILRFFGEYGTGRHGISAIYFYGGSGYNAVTIYFDELS